MNILEGLITQSAEHDAQKHDHTAEARDLWFDEAARLSVPPTLMGRMLPLEMTEWASRQLYSKLGPVVFGRGSSKALPYDYLTALDPDMRADVLNRHLRAAADRRWLVRGYGETTRAVLDGNYPIVSNTELLEAMEGLIKHERGRFEGLTLVRPSVTADDLNLKIVWRNVDVGGHGGWGGGSAPYGLGCYLGNGEIGNRRIRLWPLVQKHSCTNSIIVDHDEGLTLTHRGSLAGIMVLIKAALGRVFQASAETLDRLIMAEAERIPDLSDTLDGLSLKYGWSTEVRDAVAFGMEGQQTRAGLVAGVSYAAHAALDDPNAQADMEVLGGRILMADSSLFGRAAVMARQARMLDEVAVR